MKKPTPFFSLTIKNILKMGSQRVRHDCVTELNWTEYMGRSCAETVLLHINQLQSMLINTVEKVGKTQEFESCQDI